jgi:glycosyltransferase involved in cell wall biosynthesis
MAVYTTDLDEGRGDIYTAIGLGRYLEMLGYEMIYLPRDRWYELPQNTGYFVAMLETVDLTSIPDSVTTIAWVRNQAESWVKQPSLSLYNLVLCSSQPSLDLLRVAYPGATGLLPIGVDPELFATTARPEDRVGVVSTVNQWGREREVHAFLRKAPLEFPLALFGERRGMAPELKPFSRGPVSYFALPSLYNQATIVLDDFNHTTAGYGNVNSRVFEALACGATVMTNRSLGLDDLGFGNVAVYRSAAELHDLIDRDLVSSDARKAATEMARTVTERHSYKVRAAEFAELLQNLSTLRPPGSDRLLIGFFPDYRENPYLEMMWSELRRNHAIPIPVGNDLDFGSLFRASEDRPTVFHLNWTAPILGGGRNESERQTRYRQFLRALDDLQERGVPVIWTVHNVLPHECEDPALEAQFRQELADRVDVVHVMCEETARACAGRFQIPESKLRLLPHPSYVDVYPNLVDIDIARYELGLAHEDFVYLYVGKIRPYKGVDLLLDAFDRLSRHQPDAKLLLVGELGRFEGVDEIVQRAWANPNVIANFNSIPDADLQLYMNASNVVVLPYRTALNSGALQLAYSFARPVIAPEVGCLTNQINATTGIGFRWEHGDQALLNAMLAARNLGAEHGRAAHDSAVQNHYLGIAREFAQVVAGAMSAQDRYRDTR